MVLTEAMAAGVPVVALDGPGVRDVVTDHHNGLLLPHESKHSFLEALLYMNALSKPKRELLTAGARDTAEHFSLRRSVDTLEGIYQRLRKTSRPNLADQDALGLEQIMARLKAEWDIFKSVTHAGDEALSNRVSLSPDGDQDETVQEP
jgi:hypothetical protein